jgi:hypothetical protein
LNLLITIKTKDFSLLRRNEADGRIWNEFTALKAGYRRFFKYKNLRYVSTIDMRACHFSFLGPWLVGLWQGHKETPIDLSSFDVRHVTYNKKQKVITMKPNPNDNHLALSQDLGKWTDLFSNEEDPRNKISKFCGWSLEDTKIRVNSWINGNRKYPKLDQWLKKEFPALSMVWESLDGDKKKIVGNSIAETYETPIFLDIDLYEFASNRNLKLSYEYDGVGVFGDVSDPQLKTKIEETNQYIQNKIGESLGTKRTAHLTKLK